MKEAAQQQLCCKGAGCIGFSATSSNVYGHSPHRIVPCSSSSLLSVSRWLHTTMTASTAQKQLIDMAPTKWLLPTVINQPHRSYNVCQLTHPHPLKYTYICSHTCQGCGCAPGLLLGFSCYVSCSDLLAKLLFSNNSLIGFTMLLSCLQAPCWVHG